MIHTQDIQRQFRDAGALHPELDGARFVMENPHTFTNSQVLSACDYAQRNGDWIDQTRGAALAKAVRSDMVDREYDRSGRSWTLRAFLALCVLAVVLLVANHAMSAATVRPSACERVGVVGAECSELLRGF